MAAVVVVVAKVPAGLVGDDHRALADVVGAVRPATGALNGEAPVEEPLPVSAQGLVFGAPTACCGLACHGAYGLVGGRL